MKPILLVCLACACGSVPDAGDDDDQDAPGSPDAAPTADAPPPPPGEATIVAFLNGQPQQGIPVAFHAPNGELVNVVQSNAMGQAVQEIEAGSTASVFLELPGERQIHTVVGVVADDELPLGERFRRPGPIVGRVHVNLPGGVPGASGYEIELGSRCPSEFVFDVAMGVIMDVPDICRTPAGRVVVLAIANNDSGDNVAFSHAEVTLGPTGVDTIVNLPPWRFDWLATDVALSASTSAAGGGVSGAFGRGPIRFGIDDTSLDLGMGTSTGRLNYPRDLPDRYSVSGTVFFDNAASDSAAIRWINGNDLLPTYAIDLNASAIPPIPTDVQVLDPAGPTISFATSPGGDHDGFIVLMSGSAMDGTDITWFAVLPEGSSGSFSYPDLAGSPELQPFRPTSVSRVQVIAIELDDIVGYDEYRPINTAPIQSFEVPDGSSGAAAFAGDF
jgi:hypothetical protein